MTTGRVSGFTLTAVANGLAKGLSLPEAAKAASTSVSTAYKYRAEIEAIRDEIVADRTAAHTRAVSTDILLGGQRDRIRRAIAEAGTIDVPGLVRAVRRPNEAVIFDNVINLLWSIQKQGEVSFTMSSHTGQGKHGPADNAIKTIHAQDALYRNLGLPVPGNGHEPKAWPPIVPGPQPVHKVGVDRTEPSTHGSVAVGGPVERRHVDRPIPEASVVTPAAEEVMPVGVDPTDHWTQPEVAPVQPWTERYPVLGSILAKAAERANAQKRAEGYIAAAALLEALDPFESSHLQEKAEIEVKEYTLTPVEIEYLAFIDDHTCDDCGRLIGEGHNPEVEH